VAIGLVEQRDPSILPLLWVDGLAALKVGQRGLVFTELPMDSSSRTESPLRRGKHDDLIEIIECAPRLTQVCPNKMAIEIGVGISRILPQPFGHDFEEALWLGVAELVECQ
jgi:hypothetical protein